MKAKTIDELLELVKSFSNAEQDPKVQTVIKEMIDKKSKGFTHADLCMDERGDYYFEYLQV